MERQVKGMGFEGKGEGKAMMNGRQDPSEKN